MPCIRQPCTKHIHHHHWWGLLMRLCMVVLVDSCQNHFEREMRGNMGDGVGLYPLRTTKTTNDTPDVPSLQRNDPHTSLGRLLRLLGDPQSHAIHMEVAIQHHATSNVSASRKWTLSDHKHISNLGSVLETVDRAIDTLVNADVTRGTERTTAKNMVQALVTAMATQSVHACTSTKQNMCVWTTQSKKRLMLLEWILRRHPMVCRVVLEDALGSMLVGDKTNQLTACLVVFELAQHQRRQYLDGTVSTGNWSILLDNLVKIVQNSSVETAIGRKASTLGVAALDALIAVLCVTTIFNDQRPQILECMKFVLSVIMQWSARSARRQWLSLVAQHFMSLATSYDVDDSRATFGMVAWHWNASAMWFCTRSESVLAAKKALGRTVALTVDDLYTVSCSIHTHQRVEPVQHKSAAFLHRLCALFSLQTGPIATIMPMEATRGKLLIALASLLVFPTCRLLALGVLRRLLLGQPDIGEQALLVMSSEEVEAFAGMIQRQETHPSIDDGVASILATLFLRSGVATVNVYCTDDPTATQFWLSVTRHALDQYSAVHSLDQAMQTQWLRETTNAILHVLRCHNAKIVRTQAAKLIPKLDFVMCIQFVVSTLLPEIDSATSGYLIATIFESAQGQQSLTMELANTLVDALCRGIPSNIKAANPTELGERTRFQEEEGEQEHISRLSRSREGWCSQMRNATQAIILTALVRKVFGSPRDSVLVTWLRELSLLGWFDGTLAEILPIVLTHMKNLERLTEELLEDESSRASRAVEHLLFARLAPSLVLRVVPRTAFHSLYMAHPVSLLGNGNDAGHSLYELAHVLWHQVLDPLEFKDVKMISIELLTKLPIHETLPHVLDQLIAFIGSQGVPVSVVKALAPDVILPANGGFVVAKLLVYYLNLIYSDDSIVAQGVSLTDRTLAVLLALLSIPCPRTEAFSAEKSPLVDLQMGTIECLSLLVAKSIKHSLKTSDSSEPRHIEDALVHLLIAGFSALPPSQQTLLNEDGLRNEQSLHVFQLWKSAVLEGSGDHERVQVRICCCNVLLSTLAKLDTDGTSVFQERILTARILPMIQQLPPPVLAGCLQIVFSLLYKIGPSLQQGDPSSEAITNVSITAVVDILQDSRVLEDVVHINALKVLGALIGKVAWFWPNLATKGDIQESIATGLQKLRDSMPTATPAVRQLAQSLLQAVFSN